MIRDVFRNFQYEISILCIFDAIIQGPAIQSTLMSPHLVAFRRGRPAKFGRPARAITVTLPEDILEQLAVVDADLGRAIVTLVERHATPRVRRMRPAEIAKYGRHAVIVVNPARALKRLKGVELVPVGNGRALISLDDVKSISQLELDVRDVLDGTRLSVAERRTLEALAAILRQARRADGVTLTARTIIVLEARPTRQRRVAQLRTRTGGVPHVNKRA